MTRLHACLVLLVASAALAPAAIAANSTNAAPPDAKKEGGIAGDPRGAIRALGGTSQTDFAPAHNKVDVPKLGGRDGANQSSGTPPGTTGGR